MALTGAERARRYRERLKIEQPQKYKEMMKKQLERVKKNKRKINNLTESEKALKRKKWRDEKNRQKLKKKPNTDKIPFEGPSISSNISTPEPHSLRIKLCSSQSVSDLNHPNRKRRVSHTQLKHLYEFLNEHRDVAVGFHNSAQTREHCKQLWKEAASVLNQLDEGSATKSGSEWAKYWEDLKEKIKRKLRSNQEGNEIRNPSNLLFTDVEIMLLSILDPDYQNNYPNIQEISICRASMSSDDEDRNDTDKSGPYLLHSVKRRRYSQSNDLEYSIEENLNKRSIDDEYTTFGIHIANQLRNLSSLELYINAQDEIQTIVTRYRLEDLKKKSDSQFIDKNVSKRTIDDEYTTFGTHIAYQLRNLSSLELYINAQDEIHTIVTRYRLEDLNTTLHAQLIDETSIDCKSPSFQSYDDD